LPDGRLLYNYTADCGFLRFDTSCSYWIEKFDIRSGQVTETARRLTRVVGASLNNASATPDGRLVAFQRTAGYTTAYVADIQAGAAAVHNLKHFTLDEADDTITDWMPDSLTAIIVRNRGDHFAVYKQALGTEVAEPIVSKLDGALLEAAIVSPEGKWILLQVWPLPPPLNMAPRKQIWRVPIEGGVPERLFSTAPGSTLSCPRTPAAVCVIAEPSANRQQAIVSTFDPSTGKRGGELLRFERYANPNEDMGPLAFALSPDGQSLSMSPAPSGPLRILSLRGAPARELPVKGLNVKADVSWTPDGRGLIVTSYRNGGAALIHVDLQANVQELLQCESDQCFGIPSPDGRHLGISQSRVTSNIWMLENF
jgi:Tol biopolymer transport system component